ncbi:MAG: hypothetical protein ABIF82_06930 [Planctomycetota bacterium]
MGRRTPYSTKPRTRATPPALRTTGARGNRRTRGGAGRHNLGRAGLDIPKTKVRICLGCDRAFRSRGPWNRFCSRCHNREDEHDNSMTYHIPNEWPADIFVDDV